MATDTGKIAVAINRSEALSEERTPQTPASAYMYLAGLIVAESGMYAVTYDVSDQGFVLMLRLLLVVGFAVSYWMRRRRIDIRQYQAPLLVVFATVMYFVATSAPSTNFAAAGSGANRPYQVQSVIMWIAVLHSFTLCTDSAILFACVPAMALFGIISSGTTDDEVQYAFYVFLAAATFLMIYENHLRMKSLLTSSAGARRPRSDNKLFNGEVLLVGVCIAGTMLIANVVATPIQIVGKAILPSNTVEAGKDKNRPTSASPYLRVEESPNLDIGTGPRAQSDVPLLQVTSNIPLLYLRGTSYDFYAGNHFEDHMPPPQSVSPGDASQQQTYRDTSSLVMPDNGQNLYHFDPLTWDPGNSRMDHAVVANQVVRVMGGTQTHMYGVPAFKSVMTPFTTLLVSKSGSISVETSLVQDFVYKIESLVPTTNPDYLRTAPTDYPAGLKSTYLQLPPQQPASVKAIADEMVRGVTNTYDRVEALRSGIAKRCKYSLAAPAVPRDHDAVDAFLNETKVGYCDSYAAALTILCRAEGIPARIASGFLAGDRQNDASYLIREKHKHVWTEVYFPNYGWVPFDATDGTADAAQNTAVQEKSTLPLLHWLMIYGPIPPIMALTICGLLAYLVHVELLSRLKKSRMACMHFAELPQFNMQIIRIYEEACAYLAKRGIVRSPGVTPREFVNSVSDQVSTNTEVAEKLGELTALHERFSYFDMSADKDDIARARSIANELDAAIRKVPVTAGRRA